MDFVLNSLYKTAKNTNDLETSGVLVHQVDTDTAGNTPWISQQRSDRLVASLMGPYIPHDIAFGRQGGFVLNPGLMQQIQLNYKCSWADDSHLKLSPILCPSGASASCQPGCFAPGQDDWCESMVKGKMELTTCAFKREELSSMIGAQTQAAESPYHADRHFPVPVTHQIIFDKKMWSLLPELISAFFFFADGQPDQTHQIQDMHKKFLDRYHLGSSSLPLLALDFRNSRAPFKDMTQYPPPPPPPGRPAFPPIFPFPLPPPSSPSPPPSPWSPPPPSKIDLLVQRYANGHATDKIEHAGILIHQFDFTGAAEAPWYPPPGVDRMSSTLTSARMPKLFNPTRGGFLVDPVIGDKIMFCSWAEDGGTANRNCPGNMAAWNCLPGCWEGSPVWCNAEQNWNCPFQPSRLKEMCERHEEIGHGYTELVLSGRAWRQHLPYTIEAVFYLAKSTAQDVSTAKNVHAGLIAKYGLSAVEVPLVRFDPNNKKRAFTLVKTDNPKGRVR